MDSLCEITRVNSIALFALMSLLAEMIQNGTVCWFLYWYAFQAKDRPCLLEPPTMLLVPICRDKQLWRDNPPIPIPRKCTPTDTCFDDVGRICACVTWTQMYVTLQTKNAFHSKAVIILFLSVSLYHLFRYSFQYRRNSIRPSTQFIHFCRRSAVETIICLGTCTFTLRGLRFVDVGIINPILGKVLFQTSFTNYENILAHNTALVTSGNSGLPRLNASGKSSDIPPPNPVTNMG